MAIRATTKEADDFSRILAQPDIGEQPVQFFMEQHSEFVPTPFLLGHNINLEVIISKFPIDTNLVSDFTFLTKNSGRWRIVFVEIEDPKKKIFKDSNPHRAYTAEFNDALAQVKEWRDHVPRVKDAILQRLEPLMQPITMRRNPVTFKFVLVYGRRSELESDQKRMDRFMNESSDEIEVVTFDSCISEALSREKRRFNVVRLDRDGYCFKAFRAAPGSFFSWVGSRYFRITDAEKETLVKAGFDMDSWASGKDLVLNGARSSFSWPAPSLFSLNATVEKLLYP